MRYVIPIMLLVCMFSIGNAAKPRKHKDCECTVAGCIDSCKACDVCRECIKRRIRAKIKERAAEEGKRRRDRIARAKEGPIVIHIYHNYYNYRSNRYRGDYVRRFRRGFNHHRHHHHHHHHKKVDTRPRLWHDGLRTRTDRPTHRR